MKDGETKMRLIDANKLIDCLYDEGHNNSSEYGFEWGDIIKFTPSQIIKIIKNRVPQITEIYGYDIERLIKFAIACRQRNISNEDLKEFCGSFDEIYKLIAEENKKIFDSVFSTWQKDGKKANES